MGRALLILGLALAGCTILDPRPDPSRFFTLSATAESPEQPPAGGIAVGLGPVRVPAYLDRPELATRVASSEVAFSPRDRWAEPLSGSLRRVLAQNLSVLLGSNDIVSFPWPVGTHVDYAVSVDVVRFERTPDGEVDVTARWVIRDGAGGRIRLAREARHTQKAKDASTPAAVDAWDEALSALSADIASGIASLGATPDGAYGTR